MTSLRRAWASLGLVWLLAAGVVALGGEACIDTAGLAGDGGSVGDVSPTDRETDGGDGGGGSDATADTFVGCGPTNKDCLGGACVNGRCEAFKVTPDEATTVLDVAVFGEHVYYRIGKPPEPGAIIRCKKTGCGSERKEIAAVSMWGSFAMTVRADGVYFFYPQPDSVAVAKCPLDGCAGPPLLLTPPVGDASPQIAVHEDTIYYGGSGKVWSCPITGCRPPSAGPVAIANIVTSPAGVAVYDGHLVYAERGDPNGVGGRVTRVSFDGGGATDYPGPPLAPLYVVNAPPAGFLVSSYPMEAGVEGQIVLYSNTPFRSETYRALQGYVNLVSDGKLLYFTTNSPSGLKRKALDESPSATIDLVVAETWGLALDEKSLFYSVVRGPGAVYRLAK